MAARWGQLHQQPSQQFSGILLMGLIFSCSHVQEPGKEESHGTLGAATIVMRSAAPSEIRMIWFQFVSAHVFRSLAGRSTTATLGSYISHALSNFWKSW